MIQGVIHLKCPHYKKKLSLNTYYCDYCGKALPIQKTSTLEFNKTNIKIGIITLVILIGCALLCLNLFKSQSTPINQVQSGVIDFYDSEPIGTSFNHYFTNPHWESFETDTNEIVVEFTGELQSENSISNYLIQFTVYPNRHTFEITYYERDGESQTYESLLSLLDNIYLQ